MPTTTTATVLQLVRVRHELDTLASARALDRLSDLDEVRYRDLCRAERTLLKA